MDQPLPSYLLKTDFPLKPTIRKCLLSAQIPVTNNRPKICHCPQMYFWVQFFSTWKLHKFCIYGNVFYITHMPYVENFRFLHICHVETSEISPHVEKFSISPQLSYMESWNFSTWQFFPHKYNSWFSGQISGLYERYHLNSIDGGLKVGGQCLVLVSPAWLRQMDIYLQINYNLKS